MKFRTQLRRLDWPLLIVTLLLLFLGWLILFAINFKSPELVQNFNPNKQVITGLIGLGLLYLFARIDYHVWLRFGKWWYVAGLAMLAIVFVIAHGDSTRQISLGILQFQPAEFMKIGVIMALATLFTKKYKAMSRWRYLAMSLALVGLPAVLIAIQPDLGSAITVAFIWGVLILMSKANKKRLLVLFLIVAALAPLLYANLQPYQRQRIASFLNPKSDPRGAGYNVLQSTIAVGSGGWFGRGLGAGTQSQLNFLPSQQTDFVFAVLAEKLGFVGAALTIALFCALLVRMVMIGWHANDYFGMMLAVGIAAMFLVHVTINIGMNLGLLPVTGIPLPFISYGGTFLIICMIAIGLLESVRIHRSKLSFRS